MSTSQPSDRDSVQDQLAAGVQPDQEQAIDAATQPTKGKEEIPFIRKHADPDAEKGPKFFKCKGCKICTLSRSAILHTILR